MDFEGPLAVFYAQLMKLFPQLIKKLFADPAFATATANALPTIINNEFDRSNIWAIFEDLFGSSAGLQEGVVSNAVAALSDDLDLPLKYTPKVFDSIQGESIFKGYADKTFAKDWTRREINDLKKIILQGKYGGQSEQQILNNLKARFTNMTYKRAQMLARTETKRLQEAINRYYFRDPAVLNVYERVWVTQHDDRVRPQPEYPEYNHKIMHNKVADKDGYFHHPQVGRITGPGDQGTGSLKFIMGCRCYTIIRRKRGK